MGWGVEFVNEAAAAELDALPADMRARFEWIVDLITQHGLHKVRAPHVKPLGDKLWEMRLSGRAGIARSIYLTASERRIIVLRTFVKKTRKTPAAELEIARRRAALLK